MASIVAKKRGGSLSHWIEYPRSSGKMAVLEELLMHIPCMWKQEFPVRILNMQLKREAPVWIVTNQLAFLIDSSLNQISGWISHSRLLGGILWTSLDRE